ncbi:glycosyltransferase [Methanolacinia petrolearia]|uniref:glycosyltransferase n=1 Tax=Methanolacinia petrolearia TaxID=54120 RepID=UPI003BAA1301
MDINNEKRYFEQDFSAKLKDKTLLIISPIYPNQDETFIKGPFVKNQVDELKKYFKKIIVIAPVLHSLKIFKNDKLCRDYSYDSVEVYYPRCYYIPIEWFNKFLIDTRFKAVENCIKEKQLSFDLIHAHFTWPAGYISIKLKGKYNKKVLITIHEDSGWFDREVEMDYYPINDTWSKADALIRVNKKDLPILKEYNDHVYFVPNGFSPIFHPIDTNLAREKLNIPQEAQILFTLGDLIKRKGFNYLIDAMDLICKKNDNVFCFIGGEGLEKRILQKQIDKLHLSDKIKLIGFVPMDRLNYWMNACDLFILPSLKESFGVVQIEAMACGKPVVASWNGGSEEIIISDRYGFLAKTADSKDLVEKILSGLDKEWDKESILEYAKQFTWNTVVQQNMELYNSVLN